MNFILLLVAFFLSSAISHAQVTTYPDYAKLQVLDTIRTVVQYDLVYYKNHEDKSEDDWNHPINVKMTVEVGDRIQHSIQSWEHEIDLIMMDQEKKGIGRRASTISMHAQNGEIYMGFPENKLTAIINIQIAGMYKYEETIPQMNWTLTEETKTIKDLACKKATMRFRGRDYVAWYAVDIPLDCGPWKFHGLPGLIVELADTDNDYHFTLNAIDTPKNAEYIYWWDRNYTSTTKKQCLKTQDAMLKNATQFFAKYGRVLLVDWKEVCDNSNNPIELEE